VQAALPNGLVNDDHGRPSEAADALEEERDPETYDDTEFYQTLLKEFLEGSGDASAANWYSVGAPSVAPSPPATWNRRAVEC
jgi:hypothetical protein